MTARHAASARASQISLPLKLSIGDIEDGDIGVAPPTIAEADDDRVVDLGTFEGNATVHVDAWPLMAAGQRYWLTAIAGTETYVVADGALVTGPATLDLPLPRAWLEGLADGASFDIELAIAFGGGELATAKRFTSAAYWLRQENSVVLGRAYECEDFECDNVSVHPGERYRLRFCTVFPLGPYSAPNFSNASDYLAPPHIVGRFGILGNGAWSTELQFDAPADWLRIGASAWYRPPAQPTTAQFVGIDSRGVSEVHTVGVTARWEEFGTEELVDIATLRVAQWAVFDNLVIRTGKAWGVNEGRIEESFAGVPIGEHGSDMRLARWHATGNGARLAIEQAPPSLATRCLAVHQGSTAKVHYLTPQFAARPVRAVTLQLRTDSSVTTSASVTLYYIDHVRLTLRATGLRTIRIDDLSQIVTWDAAGDLGGTQEYFSHFRVVMPANATLYYDRIVFD